MFGSFLHSFKDKVVYGASTEGSGGGDDDDLFLRTIELPSDDDDDDNYNDNDGDDDNDNDNDGDGDDDTTIAPDPEPRSELFDNWKADDEAFFAPFENYLEVRYLMDEGYSISEAQMLVNGTTIDEFVFTVESGSYAEAGVIDEDVLFSSGIDVSDGVIVVDPERDGIPSFAVPANSGGVGFSTDDTFYHEYYVSVPAPDDITGEAGLAAIEWAL